MSLVKASLKPSAAYARTPYSPHRSNAHRALFARNTGGPNSASRVLSSPLATADRARKILPCHDESCDTVPLASRGEGKTRASRLTVVGCVAVVARLMAPPASSVVHHRTPEDSLVSERLQRVEPGCAPGGNVASREGRGGEESRHEGEDRRGSGGDAG